MDEGEPEILTYEQFAQEMKHPGSVQGTPMGTAPLVSKREPVSGTELIRKRVQVSFYFDVTCDNGTILNSDDEEEMKQYDLDLLNSFLVADKEKLLHMLVDAVATQLGLNSTETFVAQFLPQIDTNSHILFSKAIDALRGDAGDYWRETREEEDLPWGDVLSLATEKLFECFEAKFVSSSYYFAGEQEHDN